MISKKERPRENVNKHTPHFSIKTKLAKDRFHLPSGSIGSPFLSFGFLSFKICNKSTRPFLACPEGNGEGMEEEEGWKADEFDMSDEEEERDEGVFEEEDGGKGRDGASGKADVNGMSEMSEDESDFFNIGSRSTSDELKYQIVTTSVFSSQTWMCRVRFRSCIGGRGVLRNGLPHLDPEICYLLLLRWTFGLRSTEENERILKWWRERERSKREAKKKREREYGRRRRRGRSASPFHPPRSLP